MFISDSTERMSEAEEEERKKKGPVKKKCWLQPSRFVGFCK